jgi:hypothetical protein
VSYPVVVAKHIEQEGRPKAIVAETFPTAHKDNFRPKAHFLNYPQSVEPGPFQDGNRATSRVSSALFQDKSEDKFL